MKLSKLKILAFLIIITMLLTESSLQAVLATTTGKTKIIEITVPYIDMNTKMLYVNQGGWLSGYRSGEPNIALKWTSSNPSILTIYNGPKGSNDCAFVAKKAGIITITASDSTGYKEKIKITVAEKAPDAVNLGKLNISSNGEKAVLYYKVLTFTNNEKAGSGLLVNEAGSLCVSMGGRLKESITNNHILYMNSIPTNTSGSWYIKLTSKSFTINGNNSYNTIYTLGGYYDDKNNSVPVRGDYLGSYYINNKKYKIDQIYTSETGWKYNKYKYYSNRQLLVRYGYFELIKMTRASSDTIADIDNYTLNLNRASIFRNDFEHFDIIRQFSVNKNADAKYGEDTSKPELVINEGTILAEALKKYCGVSTVEELPTIMPIDQEYYYYPDLCIGTFDNYYVITEGEKAGNIVYVGDDGSGIKDEYGVIWFGISISS